MRRNGREAPFTDIRRGGTAPCRSVSVSSAPRRIVAPHGDRDNRPFASCRLYYARLVAPFGDALGCADGLGGNTCGHQLQEPVVGGRRRKFCVADMHRRISASSKFRAY